MLLMLGYAGALLAGVSAYLLLVTGRVSSLVHLCHGVGMLWLALYGAFQGDYPVLVFGAAGVVFGIAGLWRLRRSHRRARTVDVTLHCEPFARARQAARTAFKTQVR